MGFFDFLHGADINEGVELFRSTPGALLLDVRTAQEYAGGHIPGSESGGAPEGRHHHGGSEDTEHLLKLHVAFPPVFKSDLRKRSRP